MKNSLVLFILISLLGCKDDQITQPDQKKSTFEIYFLKDTTLTMGKIKNSNVFPFIANLQELELADKPWITQDDIEFYEWATHNIYLKKDKSNFFPGTLEFAYRFPKSWTDRPWIVVANGTPCYAGFFGTEQSTLKYPFPEINALCVGFFPKDVLTSLWYNRGITTDIRFNNVVKETLKQCGIFREGIEVSIDTTGSPVKVYADTTAEYTFKFKNNDTGNLYLFDPAKVKPDVFPFYAGQMNFRNTINNKNYWTEYKNVKIPNGWPNEFDPSWYTLLKSGESVKRTFRMRSYPSIIPVGTYSLQTQYTTPVHALEKNIRETPQGRYFICGGSVFTDTVRVVISRVY